MVSTGMIRRVALVRTEVSEEISASVIRGTRVVEIWTTIAVTSNRRTLLVSVSFVPSAQILVTLMKEVLSFPKLRFLQEPHGVTSQKTPFFIVTAVKTSNLTYEIGLTKTREDGLKSVGVTFH
jgi:hypothetical protein